MSCNEIFLGGIMKKQKNEIENQTREWGIQWMNVRKKKIKNKIQQDRIVESKERKKNGEIQKEGKKKLKYMV